jgi:hypothetical protein
MAASTIVGAFALSTLVPALALSLHQSTAVSSAAFFVCWYEMLCSLFLLAVHFRTSSEFLTEIV